MEIYNNGKYMIIDKDEYGDDWYCLYKHRDKNKIDRQAWNYYEDWFKIEDSSFDSKGLDRLYRLMLKSIYIDFGIIK